MPRNTAYRDTKQIETTERARKAVELRAQRKTWHQIAHELSVSHEQARQDFHRALDAARQQMTTSAQTYIDEQCAVLDVLLDTHIAAHYANEQRGEIDHENTGIILKIQDQRAKLLGLYPQGSKEEGDKRPSIVLMFNQQNNLTPPLTATDDHQPVIEGRLAADPDDRRTNPT